MASLEEQVARLQAEADQAKKAAAAAQAQVQAQGSVPTPPTSSTRPRQNGYKRLVGGGSSSNSLARPDSRASMSTINSDARAPTPTAPTQSKKNGNASPRESVWDSIHAPAARRDNPIRLPTTPKARGANAYRGGSYYRPQIPSPTPSNVSAAPTLGGDGWWS